MKRNKIFLMLVGAFAMLLFGAQEVFASTLTYDWSGYYYERQYGDGSHHSSYYLQNYYMDGNVAYCVEPGVHEGTTQYKKGSWEDLGLDNSIKDRILLIAHYGYQYEGHQTVKYRAATQAMLWEAIMGEGSWVTFNTELWSRGDNLDVSNERAEINRLIDHHYDKPSINGRSYTVQVGESITLEDTNNTLNNYEVRASNGADVSINGNKITITPTKSGNITITLVKKQYYERNYLVYYANDYQNMITGGNVDPVTASISIDSYYSYVEFNKKDSETGNAQGQASLGGAVYGVYNSSNQLVTKVTTDDNGYGKSDAVLPKGEFYLKEITPSTGYYLDNTRYPFDTSGKVSVTFNVKETVIKNFISILKQYDYVDGNTTFLNAEKGIQFEIYYPDGRLFNTITTDKNGYATLEIPYGVWKFHQVNTTTGFEKIYDFYITVDENSEKEQYYNVLNNSLNAYLQVFKTDSETGKTIALADTTFKIYNVDTKQYVSQYVGGKVYSEFKTDETGKFVTYLKLPSGNYKLVEISSPNNYLKDTNGLYFTIGNDTYFNYTTYGPFITVYFKNTPIKGQVEVNKTGESVQIEDGNFNYVIIPLPNVTFNIYASEDILSADGNYLYYSKGDLVDTITTDENGYGISKKLPLGKYMIVEVSVSDNYVLDITEHYFELTAIDDKTPVVYESKSVLNYYKKGTLEFTKTDLTTGKVIPNTKIEVYTEDDQLVFTGVTDENGKIVITDLFVGKFYIVETEASTGYKLSDEKVYFEIKDNGEIVKSEMKNEKIKGTLEFSKVDLVTSDPLPNTTIQIYDAETDTLIFEGITDENGKLVIENLEYGKFYILEKNAPEGYQLNTEKMYFEITEDGEIVKATMTNELIITEVPNTEQNEFPIFELVSLFIIGLGMGVIVYARKNKKK